MTNMARKLLVTTALATLIATGAMAQTTPPTAQPSQTAPAMNAPAETRMMKQAEGHLASNIIGETVYNGASNDAENIGEVNDIVLGPDGQLKAIVVGVGGFLGIGEKNVALEWNLAQWVERDNDEYIVVETTQEALEALPEFDLAAYEFGPADTQVGQTEPATAEDLAAAQQAAPATNAAPADQTAAAPMQPAAPAAPVTQTAPATDTAAAPANEPVAGTDTTQTAAIDRSTLTQMEMGQIRTEDFVGTTVYGANEENVGEVGDIIMSADGGGVDAVILDVGGFLGMGEKEVALGLDNLQFMSDADGELYVYTNLSKEQLEAQPAYDETGYAANRDTMRMVVPN
jgi:sporulation protein YlmC with PRC-barrel domain